MGKKRGIVCGVGINDAGYVVRKSGFVEYVDGSRKKVVLWTCPYYSRWCDMLTRCYSTKSLSKSPTYTGCSVSKEWLTFSNFKMWMQTQQWEGLQLDKDIIVSGNKEYSASTCCFIPSWLNLVLIDAGASRGKYPMGVSLCRKSKVGGKNPFSAQEGQKYIGRFPTPMAAHAAWQKSKIQSIECRLNDYCKLPSFNTDVVNSLVERIERLSADILFGVETISL